MTKQMSIFEVYKGTTLVGTIKAPSHPVAVARAHYRYGICEVELQRNRKPCYGDRLSANICQQGKQSRRYPVIGFEARRKALIEALNA